MAEREFPIEQVGIEYVCDTCQQGTMQVSGKLILTEPMRWPHRCSQCGAEAELIEQYPTVRFRTAAQKGGA